MQWKSRAARLERKARPRSGSPRIIANSSAPVLVVSTIGALDMLTVVVIDTVTIIVAVNVIAAHTMVLTFIGVVSNRRRASSWVVLSRY